MNQIAGRKCGQCRECCIVLEVEPTESPKDQPCKHLCAKGCGIYAGRPESCKEFSCAWLQGFMGRNDQPNRTHMVMWASKLLGVEKHQLTIIQCNVGRGAKRHKKTMRWLVWASHKLPVMVVEGDYAELFSRGKSIVKWHEGDFIRFDHDDIYINSATVVPKAEALMTDADIDKWNQAQVAGLTIHETDPEFQKATLKQVGKLF